MPHSLKLEAYATQTQAESLCRPNLSLMYHLIPLTFLPVGAMAVIGQVAGKPAEVQRLEELGLRCDVEVEMVQSGSPCIIRVGESKLCFRESEVFQVLVRQEDCA